MSLSRAIRRLRKKEEGKVPRKKPKAFLEALEPRLLLSADDIVGGLAANLAGGLNEVGNEIRDLIRDDLLFDKYVPGIVVTRTLGDNVYQVSPTLEEAMSINVDVYSPSKPAGGGGDLQARFNYIEDLESAVFMSEAEKDELALRTMDLNSDGKVAWDEAFNVMVVGQLQDYLSDTTIINQDGDTDTDASDLAIQVRKFLDGSLGLLQPELEIPAFP